jgi:hypothetical protein
MKRIDNAETVVDQLIDPPAAMISFALAALVSLSEAM